MAAMTTAERRGYRLIRDEGGALLVVAADQRGGMRAALAADPDARKRITDAQLGEVKADIATHLAAHAGAILLDPVCAVPGIVDADVLPRSVALVVGLDASGYAETAEGYRVSAMVPGVTARRVRALGGTAGKVMVWLRPDRPEACAANMATLRAVVADFAAEDVLLVVEFLLYPLPGEAPGDFAAATPELAVEGCRLCLDAGAKLLKIPYPGSPEACRAVTRIAGGAPWAVLSAGVTHEAFMPQVEAALAAGAAGVIAGRSLWKDCVTLDRAETRRRLETVAVPRLREIGDAIRRHRGR